MTPTNLEKLKAEVVPWVSTNVPKQVRFTRLGIAEIIDAYIDHLSTTHRLIDLEKVEGMRKTKTPYLQDHGFNAALDAVIALVKGEK